MTERIFCKQLSVVGANRNSTTSRYSYIHPKQPVVTISGHPLSFALEAKAIPSAADTLDARGIHFGHKAPRYKYSNNTLFTTIITI
jgi:hypothetical protein